jgi:GT2 family glycosyltransferase
MDLSAIVIALQEGENLRLTVEQLLATLPSSSEIIVVDDGSTDGSADFLRVPGAPARLVPGNGGGVAASRNLGASHATGTVLLFIDAHMTLPGDWWKPLVDLLDGKASAASPGVRDVVQSHRKGFGLRITGPELTAEWLGRTDSPCAVPVLPGCSLAIRRDVFQTVGGFDSGMIRSQGIDNEFCLRLWLLGHECWVAPEVEVVHLFRERMPYELRWEMVIHNRLRLALQHFDRPRIARAVEVLRAKAGFPGAMALIADSDVLVRRAELSGRRIQDANWFFSRFGPAW